MSEGMFVCVHVCVYKSVYVGVGLWVNVCICAFILACVYVVCSYGYCLIVFAIVHVFLFILVWVNMYVRVVCYFICM